LADGRADRSFPKAHRLVTSDDYRRVYRNARRGRIGPFTWHARPNACQHPRLGLAVPKRVVKRATGRSRLKRLIRESFRHQRTRLPAVDVIISVRVLPADLRDPALHGQVARIWDDVAAHVVEAP